MQVSVNSYSSSMNTRQAEVKDIKAFQNRVICEAVMLWLQLAVRIPILCLIVEITACYFYLKLLNGSYHFGVIAFSHIY